VDRGTRRRCRRGGSMRATSSTACVLSAPRGPRSAHPPSPSGVTTLTALASRIRSCVPHDLGVRCPIHHNMLWRRRGLTLTPGRDEVNGICRCRGCLTAPSPPARERPSRGHEHTRFEPAAGHLGDDLSTPG
jgi:hypothetical protein